MNESQKKLLNNLLVSGITKIEAGINGNNSHEIMVSIQDRRSALERGEIPIIAPVEVIEAMQKNLPYDKSKVKALNPENQDELDRQMGATKIDKIRRSLRRE